jgi:hypothetical protein
MKTTRARVPASTMLMFDSHWMPLATPDTAEATKAIASLTYTPGREWDLGLVPELRTRPVTGHAVRAGASLEQ